MRAHLSVTDALSFLSHNSAQGFTVYQMLLSLVALSNLFASRMAFDSYQMTKQQPRSDAARRVLAVLVLPVMLSRVRRLVLVVMALLGLLRVLPALLQQAQPPTGSRA